MYMYIRGNKVEVSAYLLEKNHIKVSLRFYPFVIKYIWPLLYLNDTFVCIYCNILYQKKKQPTTFSRFSLWILLKCYLCKDMEHLKKNAVHKLSWQITICTRKLEHSLCSIIFRFRNLFFFLYSYYKYFKYFSLKTKNNHECQSTRVAINLVSLNIY